MLGFRVVQRTIVFCLPPEDELYFRLELDFSLKGTLAMVASASNFLIPSVLTLMDLASIVS